MRLQFHTILLWLASGFKCKPNVSSDTDVKAQARWLGTILVR